MDIYDELLASVGARAEAIAPRLCVSHWPHVGSAYDGSLLIVGQALRGWVDKWVASEVATSEGRARVLAAVRAQAVSRAEPLGWVPTQVKVRNSPSGCSRAILPRHLFRALRLGTPSTPGQPCTRWRRKTRRTIRPDP